jgi:predicted Zn-dependent peptidase
MEKEGVHQTYISLIAPIKRYKRSKEQVALDIGMDLLYNYLYEKVVFEKGLCYKIVPGIFDSVEGCECLTVDVSCAPERAEKLKDTIFQALRNFLTAGLTPDSIEEARLSYLRGTLSWEDSVDTANRMIAVHYLCGYKSDPFEDTYSGIKNIKDLTVKSIMAECLSAKMKISTMAGE